MHRLSKAGVRFAAIALAIVIARPVVAQDDAPPRKYALLIGLNHYLLPRVSELKYAKNDAMELKRVLEEQGFDDVVPLVDDAAERDKIVAHLSRIAILANQQDTFLLYFAGHGLRKVGRTPTYWLTFDANIDQIDVAGIRLNHLLDYVADIKAKQKIVILDHCFSGNLDIGPANDTTAGPRSPSGRTITIVPPGANARPGIPVDSFSSAAQAAGSGTIIIAAARGFAYELDASHHGVLTTALLKAMQTREADANHDARLSADELANYVRAEVRRMTNNAQDPQVSLSQSTNLDNWIVAEHLKIDGTEARALVTDYNNMMTKWNLKGLFTQDDIQNGVHMLEVWIDSFGNGLALTADQQKLIESFRSAADDKQRSDIERASQAKSAIAVFNGH